MAQLQAVWNKLNPRERTSAIGAGVIALGWLVGIASYTPGAVVLALLAALVLLGVLYAKYAPNMKVSWPADPSLINLAVSALAALLVLVGLLSWFSSLNGIASLALVITVIGTAVMLWGAWQEYSIVKPALPSWATGSDASSGTAPSTAAPPPPPAPRADDDHDEAPPA
ncbi:MAG TPA: hypothetical protein VFJ71_01245 [Candidatus Limnocylindrales bacterium]|nr:hypothetical protein [Candidatus Limnocylindrales bacterium]